MLRQENFISEVGWSFSNLLKSSKLRNLDKYSLPAAKKLLIRMIENGPKEFKFKPSLLKSVLVDASELLKSEPSLLEVWFFSFENRNIFKLCEYACLLLIVFCVS